MKTRMKSLLVLLSLSVAAVTAQTVKKEKFKVAGNCSMCETRIENAAGFCCMTFVECEGTGQYSDHERKHISEKYPFADAYRVIKLEILASEEHVQEIIGIIRKKGRTGYRGDGMIIVSPVEEVYKVRTDETGILAI